MGYDITIHGNIPTIYDDWSVGSSSDYLAINQVLFLRMEVLETA